MNDIGMILGFIAVFGVGSMVGMVFVGILIGIPFGTRFTSIQKIFRYVIGTLNLVIGFNIMYQIRWLF